LATRTSIKGRLWLVAGIALALAFWIISGGTLDAVLQSAIKGGSVAALAGYALSSSRAPDARLIAAVMAAGAAGDVGIEFSTQLGGGLFLLSHLVAIALYLRNRRPAPVARQNAAAFALLVGVPLAAWMLARDPMAVIYAVALGSMAATAWLSRFSRYHVGIGVLLFVVSDLLIFARLGGGIDQSLSSWFVWPLYYAGQFLICTGVIRALRGDHSA
jgi:uncharacterized membrane protein YhhN